MTLSRITAEVSFRRISVVLAPVVVVGGVAVAAKADLLPLALPASVLAILLLVGLRSPVLVLVLVAALVPFEETLVFGGVVTASRLVGVIFAIAYVANRGQLPRLSIMPAAGWAFVLLAVASGLWVVDVASWQDPILTLLQLFVLAWLVGDLVSRDPPAARKVMWAYSASAVVTVFVLIAAPSVFSTDRLTAFSGYDPAEYSAVLVPAFLFLAYEAARAISRSASGRLTAVVMLAGAGLLAWGALATGTRSAMVGLGVGLALMTVTGTGHRGGRLAVAAVGLVGAGAALLVPSVVDSVLARLSDALSTGGAGRQDIWAVGATIFSQHPVFGVGFGGFLSAFTPDVIRISAVPGLDPGALLNARAPHSILVGTAAELGILGIVFLGLFLWHVASARSSLGLSNFARVALVAILAQAMLLDVLNRKQLWFVLGIAVGLAAATRIQKVGIEASGLRLDARQMSAWQSRGRSETPVAQGQFVPPSEVA